MSRNARPPWHSAFLEIGLEILLLGALTFLFSPFSSYGALTLVALVAIRNGVREGLAAAVSTWGFGLALAWRWWSGVTVLRLVETYTTLAFLLAGGVAFGAIGLGQRRALRMLERRVEELELELADLGVKFLEAVEKKRGLERRLAKDRSLGSDL